MKPKGPKNFGHRWSDTPTPHQRIWRLIPRVCSFFAWYVLRKNEGCSHVTMIFSLRVNKAGYETPTLGTAGGCYPLATTRGHLGEGKDLWKLFSLCQVVLGSNENKGPGKLFRGFLGDEILYCWSFRIPANQLRLVAYPILYRVLYIPGGAGFLPSTVGKCR